MTSNPRTLKWPAFPAFPAFLLLLSLVALARAGAGGPLPAGRGPVYWLVLRDGQRVAARGELEIRERTACFRDLNGVLRSVRLEVIDLEATGRGRAVPAPSSLATSRNVEIAEPASAVGPAIGPPLPHPVGLAGETAKRAGQVGSFTDLSGVVTAQPAPAAPARSDGQKGRRKKSAPTPSEPTADPVRPPQPPPARP